MKVLLTVVDLNEEVALCIKEHGYQVINENELTDVLCKHIEIIMSNGTGKITKELLDKLPNVKMIDNFGVGYDGVDVGECSRRNIALCTTPGVLTDDVADLALGLLLDLSRNITQSHQFIHEGKWAQGSKFPLGNKVSGKKVGILGLGRIGKAVAQRCSGFDMEVYYYDRNTTSDLYTKVDSLLELASKVDYLIVCAAATKENNNLVNEQVLQALGDKGCLINIARGSLIDEEALGKAIENGVIKGAALDVFAHEPHVPQSLLKRSNVIVTSHIASATVETRKQMAEIVNANFKAFLQGKELPTRLKL